MAGPTASPVEAKKIVATGVTAAPHVSRPRQASLGPRRFASIDDFGVPVVGPGLLSAQWKPGYHGPACQGLQRSSEDFC